jgi:hypothetical protein
MLNNIFQKAGFAWGVRYVFDMALHTSIPSQLHSAVAFLDFGLLILANVIMRTRLPPNRKKENNLPLVKELFTDVPFLMYGAGSFLVRLPFYFTLKTSLRPRKTGILGLLYPM